MKWHEITKEKYTLKQLKDDLVKLIHGKKRIFQSYHAEFFCCCAAKVCGKLYVCLSVTIKLHICICYKNIQKNFDSAEWLFSALMLHSRAKYGPNNALQSQPKKKPYPEPCQLALFSGKIVGICLYIAITASIWKY